MFSDVYVKFRFSDFRRVVLITSAVMLAGCAGTSEKTAELDTPLIKREPITRLAFVSIHDPSLEVQVDSSVQNSNDGSGSSHKADTLSSIEAASGDMN